MIVTIEKPKSSRAIDGGVDLPQRESGKRSRPSKPRPPRRCEAPDAPRGWPLTDSGNAERLVHHAGEDLRFVPAWEKWVVWDGKRWDADLKVKSLAVTKGIARSIPLEEPLPGIDRSELMKWAKASESIRSRQAMLAAATGEKSLWVAHDQLDSHPMKFNCSNGTLDLETGRLLRHRREDLITKCAEVAYSPSAKAPVWDGFLESAIPDPDVRAFVQRYAGYSLTGRVDTHCLVFLVGSGANGKSTFLSALQEALGKDYGRTLPPQLFTQGSNAHPTSIASLFGIRMGIATEFGRDQVLNEPLFKRATGGDSLSARRMREDFWEFTPTHKIWIATNAIPIISATDDAMWRRIMIVEFPVQFSGDQIDRKLPEKLKREAAGILNWCLEGLRAYLKDGLQPPASVEAAGRQLRDEFDFIGRFLRERLVPTEKRFASCKEVFEDYVNWIKQEGGPVIGRHAFGKELKRRGIEMKRSNVQTIVGYRLRLSTDPEPSELGIWAIWEPRDG